MLLIINDTNKALEIAAGDKRYMSTCLVEKKSMYID